MDMKRLLEIDDESPSSMDDNFQESKKNISDLEYLKRNLHKSFFYVYIFIIEYEV